MPPRLARLPLTTLPDGLVIVEARSRCARLLGLAGLADVPEHVALLLPHCRSVHTIGMRFAIDLVWFHEEVVRVDRAVPPWRVRSCRAAQAVLETRGGAADVFIAAGI